MSVQWWNHPFLILVHMILLQATFGLFLLGWWRLLKDTGHSTSIQTAAFVWLISNLGKYVPGKVLMPAGRIALLRPNGVRKATGFAIVVWEHFFLLIAALPLTIIGFVIDVKMLSWTAFVAVICVCTFALIFTFHPNLLEKGMNSILNILRKTPIQLTLERMALVRLLFVYLSAWTVYGFSGVALAHAMGIGDNIPLLVLMSAFVSSWLIGFISMLTPGGLGVREAVFVIILAKFVPVTEGMTLALFARLTWTIVEMSGAIFSLKLNKIKNVYTSPRV